MSIKSKFKSLKSLETPLMVAAVIFFSAPILPSGVNLALAKHNEQGTSSSSTSFGILLYDKALDIFNRADKVHYEHQNAHAEDQVTITDTTCDVECDCSGFAAYVLQTVAPRQYDILQNFDGSVKGHALAKTFVHFFQTLSPTAAQGGWIAVRSYNDLQRGDLIAWEKPVNVNAAPTNKKGNTGHVMIVESPAQPAQMLTVNGRDLRYVSIAVVDSSSVDHFPPEQLPPRAHQLHRDGVGRGVIRLIVDERNKAIGYWEGTFWNEGGKPISKPSMTENIAFARLLGENSKI